MAIKKIHAKRPYQPLGVSLARAEMRQLPAAGLQQILLFHLANIEAPHRLAQFFPRSELFCRVLVMRRLLHDRARPHRRIEASEELGEAMRGLDIRQMEEKDLL